jgi:hypothetical protein
MSDKKKCAHPACQCVPAGDEKYCSQYCKDAGTEDVEISCDCGHEGCSLEDSVPTGTTLPVEFA